VSQSEQTSITQRLRVLRPDSIRIKILVLVILATLLPSLTTAWISYLENERSLTAKATDELTNLSAQTARELDLWAKDRRYDLRVFASSYEVTENVEGIARAGGRATRSGAAYQRATDYLKSVSERYGVYGQLLILDPNGQVVASSGDNSATVALPDDWQARLRSEGFVAGTPYRGAASRGPEMLMAVPIVGAGERLIGTLTARVDLTTLTAVLNRFVPGETGRASLLADDGRRIATSGSAPAEGMTLLYPPETIRAQLAGDGHPVACSAACGACPRSTGSSSRRFRPPMCIASSSAFAT